MLPTTFNSKGNTFDLYLYPTPVSKRYPVVLLAHGNAELTPPFGDQIRGFAEDLSKLGYFTAVPKYNTDDSLHLYDQTPYEQILSDAIIKISKRPEVGPTRIGLIGFSLGAATAMTYIASKPKGTITVLADFFGFLTPSIRAGLSHFLRTIIIHDNHDGIVPVQNSIDLGKELPSTVDHSLLTYNNLWKPVRNHSFEPGDAADVDSRTKVTDWFVKHMKPAGV